ncbi:unnamed protein product [Linum tenue]|uniref:Uncharacterized protein n=1 Tax=Linum tenue TaxID=586396 RepID=A0AAV0P5X2_9ROSI|nr:unnamed protein product [Linum tenue]
MKTMKEAPMGASAPSSSRLFNTIVARIQRRDSTPRYNTENLLTSGFHRLLFSFQKLGTLEFLTSLQSSTHGTQHNWHPGICEAELNEGEEVQRRMDLRDFRIKCWGKKCSGEEDFAKVIFGRGRRKCWRRSTAGKKIFVKKIVVLLFLFFLLIIFFS